MVKTIHFCYNRQYGSSDLDGVLLCQMLDKLSGNKMKENNDIYAMGKQRHSIIVMIVLALFLLVFYKTAIFKFLKLRCQRSQEQSCRGDQGASNGVKSVKNTKCPSTHNDLL